MKLAIFGAGGHGGVVADIAEASGKYKEIVFFDDRATRNTSLHHWKISGDLQTFLNERSRYDYAIVAIGNNAIRLELQHKLQALEVPIATLIHPAATISKYSSIGAGTVVVANAVINIGANIGQACIINTGATVGHDCTIHDAVHVAPGVSLGGGTTIGPRSWIGIKSCTKQLCNVGADVTVGAGTVIIKDVPDRVTVAGNPARILSTDK